MIHPNVYLEGHTRVGAACEIHAGVRLVNSTVGDRATILNYSVITDSTIGPEVQLGPFAHLRPGSDVREAAHIGNFVELKKTVLGARSKASHLTYLGDATIGEGVNIGAGTITCNYDGAHKHPTVIEDGAFIGSDSQLVAPVARQRCVHRGGLVDCRGRPGRLARHRPRPPDEHRWLGGAQEVGACRWPRCCC